jgi:hypothetical protein
VRTMAGVGAPTVAALCRWTPRVTRAARSETNDDD